MGSPSEFFSRLTVAGGTPFNGNDTEERLLTANLELDAERESEIAFQLHDPNFVYLNSFGKKGPVGASATYEDMPLTVAGYEAGQGTGGLGETVLRLRPAGIQKLRTIQGGLSRPDISPTGYARDAAANAGMKFEGQDSAGRPSVSRDTKEYLGEGDDKDLNEWTTLQRLAAEEGFLVFESRNTLYFGSPQHFYDTMPNHVVGWAYAAPDLPFENRFLEAPEFNASVVKSTSDDFSFRLPLLKEGRIFPGHTVTIKGVPFTAEKLLVTQVKHPLAGPGDLQITAKRPWTIEKQETVEARKEREAREAAARNSNSGGGAVNFGPGGAGREHYAKEIIAAAKERNLGMPGARNGIATALVESELRMYASHAVPESLNYPHDAIGSDHDSIGLFQQRDNGAWGTVAERMNPRASAGMFYNAMMRFNWQSMNPGAACQRVQGSAYPAKYGQRMGEANIIVNQYYNQV